MNKEQKVQELKRRIETTKKTSYGEFKR